MEGRAQLKAALSPFLHVWQVGIVPADVSIGLSFLHSGAAGHGQG